MGLLLKQARPCFPSNKIRSIHILVLRENRVCSQIARTSSPDLRRLGMVSGNKNNRGSSSISIKPYRSFPTILYELVDDPSTDSMISWSESGKSFIVWNQPMFCNDVLPKYSIPRNMSIFKTFGFRKVDSERWEYANDDFVRGKPEITEQIQKRFLESLPPRLLVCKNSAKADRDIKRIRAYGMALQEKALAKNISNLTL